MFGGKGEPLLEPLEIDQTQDFRIMESWNQGILDIWEFFSNIEDVHITHTLILITAEFGIFHYEPFHMLPCLTSECNFQNPGLSPHGLLI